MINNRLATRNILCAVHILKLIAKKADCITKKQGSIKIKKSFLFAFSLLQNSISIEEFETFLLLMHSMFCEKKRTPTCINSIETIKTAVQTRNLQYVENILNTDFDSDNLESQIEVKIELMNNSNKSIKASTSILQEESPFTKHFQTWFRIHVPSFNTDSNQYEPNLYYSPELMELINDLLYIVPMWTGIILSKWQQLYPQFDIVTRIANNIVENWFGRLKNNILKKKKVMPSELVAVLYRRLLAKYIESYMKHDIDKSKIEKAILEKVETWKKGKNNKRMKGFYYSTAFYQTEDELEIDEAVNSIVSQQIIDLCM